RQLSKLGQLQPDILGEFFALEVLKPLEPGGFLSESPLSWFPRAAWHADGAATLDFVRRARQNFPRHQALPRLEAIVPGVYECWLNAVLGVLGDQRAVLQRLIPALDSDAGARRAFYEVLYYDSNLVLESNFARSALELTWMAGTLLKGHDD